MGDLREGSFTGSLIGGLREGSLAASILASAAAPLQDGIIRSGVEGLWYRNGWALIKCGYIH